MKGRLLDYSIQQNSGIISGDDGNRYTFTGEHWNENGLPQRGMYLDFVVKDDTAVDVYRAVGFHTSTRDAFQAQKEKVVAGILGVLLGGLGVHKFYLGYHREGAIMLVVFFVGMLPAFLGTIAISAVGIIEGVIYLLKTDEEFEEVYVSGDRPWF